jgi:(2Fe-2S) ferredoxin
MGKLANREDITKLRNSLKADFMNSDKQKIKLCCGTACRATGSLKVLDVLRAEVERRKEDIEIITTGCQGLCQKGPLMKIEPYGYFYQRISTSHVPKIAGYTLSAGFPVRELLYRDSIITMPVETMNGVPFYQKQKRLVLRNNEKIDPGNIYHYIANDGYLALEKALFTLSSEAVIEEIKKIRTQGQRWCRISNRGQMGSSKENTRKDKNCRCKWRRGRPRCIYGQVYYGRRPS